MGDNTNASRMEALRDQAISSLNSLTMGEFYRRLVADIGQKLSLKQMRYNNLTSMVQNLATRQAEISGVDVNEEAAQLLIFEHMFQAVAKYMSILRSTMSTLSQII